MTAGSARRHVGNAYTLLIGLATAFLAVAIAVLFLYLRAGL